MRLQTAGGKQLVACNKVLPIGLLGNPPTLSQPVMAHRYFMIRAIPTARATRTMMIIVQIVIGLCLLTLASLRSDALLRLRLLLIAVTATGFLPESIAYRHLHGAAVLDKRHTPPVPRSRSSSHADGRTPEEHRHRQLFLSVEILAVGGWR